LTVKVHRLFVSSGDPSAGAESFVIRQIRTDGKEVWGGHFAASSGTVSYNGELHDVTSLRSFLHVPGQARVTLGASHAVWTRADLHRDAFPVPELAGLSELTFAIRVRHKSTCRALNAAACRQLYPITYELWTSRTKTPVDGAAGKRLRAATAETALVSVASAQHGVVSGDENGLIHTSSNHSNVVHATFSDHKRYVVGCGNCLEGCDPSRPAACAVFCTTAVGDTSWDWAANNIVTLQPAFTQSANFYQVFDGPSAQPPGVDVCAFRSGMHAIRYGTGARFDACKGYVNGTPCQCVPRCVNCECDRVGTGWPRASVDGTQRPYPLYDGPWYCAEMAVVSFAKNEIPLEEMLALPVVTRFNVMPADLGVCGAGCGFYWNVEDNPAMHSLAAAARHTGAYANWRCGGGYIQTIPAVYEQDRWYADNSSGDGRFDGQYGAEAAPFFVERGAYWARDGNGILFSGRPEHGWVRYVEVAEIGGPMPTPAPTQSPSDPPGCPGGPRPVLKTKKPLWEEWCR
jgi:hypothetical protein